MPATHSQEDCAVDYAARNGSIREDWPPNFGYKKRAAGEFSRVLALARIIPASRKCRNAEQSNKVPRPRFRYSIRIHGPGTSCAGASGLVISKVPPTMRAPCGSASKILRQDYIVWTVFSVDWKK